VTIAKRLSKARSQASLARFVLPKRQAGKRLANILRNEWEFRAGRSELKSLPYLLFLDVACMCTLKCPLCFLGQGLKGRPRGRMSLETFRRAIDEFRDYAIVVHLYIRGEPLMNRELPEMITYADRARLMTVLSTNLNSMDREMAETLIDCGLKKLIVSVDGATEETYETYRVGGNLSKVLENIRVLNEMKHRKGTVFPKVVLQFLVFKFNLHEVPDIRRLADSMGVALSLQQGCLGGPLYEPYTGEHSQELIEKWIVPHEVLIDVLSKYGSRPGVLFDYHRKDGILCDEKCFFLWKMAYINWDGSVSPCCFVYREDRDFGNIHEEDYRTIWNNSEFRHARSLFRDASSSAGPRPTICDSCCMYRKPSWP
jgi:radical SAM protein with 4Fe4S-binding SPASM domain